MNPTSLPFLPALLAGLMVMNSAVISADEDFTSQRERILELAKLTTAPVVHSAEGFETKDGIRPIYFDTLPYKGKATRVFAWLGMPKKQPAPGMVLVHGGGGTAYREWVEIWTSRGFAAISIATEGQTDEPDEAAGGERRAWKRHAMGGPARGGIYIDSAEPLADQWMYHAVADTVLAHSLLRSQPGVDPEKIGLTGISWGGVVTSTVIGIDDRFAFAIPIYGCGHLADVDNHWGAALGENRQYREVWDPMVRMSRAKLPVLWLSWPNDGHFPLDAQSTCYRAAPGPRMIATLPGMKHSHPAGWNPPDSYAFAESIVRDGRPWSAQKSAVEKNGAVRVEFASSKPLDRAALISTAGSGYAGDREWIQTPAKLEKVGEFWVVTANLPSGSTAWLVNVRAGELTASSEYYTLPLIR